MKLSKENYDKLNENFLYRKEPLKDNSFSVGTMSEKYHCKNWTFKVYKKDGRAWMKDTYFNNTYEQVTDKNINEYEKVFDFREVKKIDDSEIDEYEPKDLIAAATDSGGYYCGHFTWVKKTAKKSKRLLIKKSRERIKSLEFELRCEKEKLNNLISKKESDWNGRICRYGNR